MKPDVPRHSMHMLFIVLLMGMFAVLSVFLVLLGTQTYQSSVNRTAQHNESRVAQNYIRSALRSEDLSGRVQIKEENGITVLEILQEDEDGSFYARRIFCSEGKLMESYTSAERAFSPNDGDAICDLLSLEASMDTSGLTLQFTEADGQSATLFFALRAAGGQ